MFGVKYYTVEFNHSFDCKYSKSFKYDSISLVNQINITLTIYLINGTRSHSYPIVPKGIM